MRALLSRDLLASIVAKKLLVMFFVFFYFKLKINQERKKYLSHFEKPLPVKSLNKFSFLDDGDVSFIFDMLY